MSKRDSHIRRYEIVETINDSAASTIHLVTDRGAEQLLVLKIMTPDAADDPTCRELFIKQAQAIRRINTDKLVKVHDIHTHQQRPYVVMEYCSRGSLQTRIDDLGRPLRVDEAFGLARQLATPIAALHHLGYSHGDISPANVLIRQRHFVSGTVTRGPLASDEELALINLGSNYRSWSADSKPGPGFLSPQQQLDPDSIDFRSDVYSASALIVWAATGQTPQLPSSDSEFPFDLSTISLTGPLAAVLSAGLCFNPKQRPADISKWYLSLSQHASG